MPPISTMLPRVSRGDFSRSNPHSLALAETEMRIGNVEAEITRLTHQLLGLYTLAENQNSKAIAFEATRIFNFDKDDD